MHYWSFLFDDYWCFLIDAWWLFSPDANINNITEEIPCHGNLRYPDYEYSNSIFSTTAGEYSVSKVNIAIGIIEINKNTF